MRRKLSLTALLVRDYDEAIDFFVGKLDFELQEDTKLTETKRWTVVSPGSGGGALLLARAVGPGQSAAIGCQSGSRVFLFLETDDLGRDHELFSARGVRFLEEIRLESYGRVAVFQDLYGNKWDLIQPSA